MKKVAMTIVCAGALGAFAASASAQDAAKGAKVYTDQKCSTCHAIAGKGNAKGALDDVGTKFTAAEIREWIVDPVGMTAKHKSARKPAMTAKYAALPKDDLDALVAYLSSLKK
jgi:mono/diheme cytochrome c family protein